MESKLKPAERKSFITNQRRHASLSYAAVQGGDSSGCSDVVCRPVCYISCVPMTTMMTMPQNHGAVAQGLTCRAMFN